ncbi:unnamed protein product [Cuscuta campestris]|uniref:Thioredoxin-like fold domain-containing protein n=1 Tax=Cuscuta campestris TaxID=132261 RepID=A0A484KY58_9ASTE|nr:unnamed protein product [Cuscuta campestris]
MEAERRRSDEDPSGKNGESDSRSKRPGVPTFLSDRTVKLLEERISFPNLSRRRQQYIKRLISVPAADTSDGALSKEHKMGSYFDTEFPIYPDTLLHDMPNVEVCGKQVNVLDLLGPTLWGFNSATGRESFMGSASSKTRGNDENNATLDLTGRYIMICCVYVPLLWCSVDGPMVYHTALASHELSRRDDCGLVVVPMMREGFTHSRSAYLHFLSGLSCHAVPFHESRRRESICSALGFDGKPKLLILDPSHKVLYHGPPIIFSQVGGNEHDCFPFTPERMDICLRSDSVLKVLSLNDLLGLSDTDVLFNIFKDAQITISKLKQKFVWLYVCSDCTSLRKVREVHEECRQQNYELEIVVVCCPFYRQVPPHLHEGWIIEALAKLKLLGWFFFPFNNTVSHRVSRMCENGSHEEGLLIVDPIENYVDPYGLSIIRDFGMDGYPFTRRNLVEKEFQRIMGLRLNSLLLPLEYACRKRGSSSFVMVRVENGLKNKTVVLYLYTEEKFLGDKLAKWYKNNIKGMHSNGVEVVAVSIDGSRTSDKHLMEKGWLVCRADPSKAAKLCDEYFHPLCGRHETLVAFGKDGLIQSMGPSHILKCRAPPFHGKLREEIAQKFEDAGFQYMRDYDHYSQ